MKGKKRISLVAALVCIFALVFSLGIMSACGNSDSGNAQVTESASGNWYYGSVLPAEGLGEEGDFYLNTKTLASYKKTAAGWSTVSLEESGEWLYGVGQPDAEVGSANDFYLDTQNGDLYHKTANGWENILKLFGKNGRDGVVWFSGNGNPNDLEDKTPLKDAIKGDFYLDYPLFDVYQLGEDGKTWSWLGSLKGSDGETPALPEAEKVTVTFDVNGGNALEAESVEVAKGDSIAALPVPTRKNYTFLGWFTGTDVNDGQVTTVTPISRSMTLVAHWVFSGRYTFDSVIVDGAAINPTDGSEFYLGSTHTIEFHAHGADDSFLQIWYSVDEKGSGSLWNGAINGKTYTKGYVGLTQRGASGEMTLTLSSAEFTDAGTYFVWMETDGRTSLRYKFTVKAMPEITPSAEVKLEDGAIENPTETKTLYAGNAKTYNFILSHDAISSISKASAEATGKPRLVLGMNISFPGASGYDVIETQDKYDNGLTNKHPETVPYQYTFVYGEENNRWFGNDPNRPGTHTYAYENNQAKVDGVVRISNFVSDEGYIGFTLEINITYLLIPSGCTAVSINPTLVYEFEADDGTTTRFDVIGNKKLEEGGEKTKLALSYEKTQLATTFVVNSLFYNSVTTGHATFTYKGSPEDFQFNGFYINGQSIEENESYNDGTIKLLYRYLGVTEEKGECTATVDVYAFEVLEASDTKYIYSVDYTFKGAQATLQSQTYQYNRLKDAEVRLEFDAFLLEAWHHMVNEEKWVGSQDKKVQYAQQLVNELWENRASLTLTDYELITESNAANGLHKKVLSGGSPFGTTSNDAANVACQAFVAGLLETYDGVSRMTIYQWIKTYLGRQSFSNSNQSDAISQFLMLVFYGFSDQMFGYGSRSAPVGFLNANLFGSVENYLYMLGLIFDRVAPQTTPELLDAVTSRAADSETDTLIHDAYVALQQAFNAYHANPNEATLADYATAVDNYTYSIDPRKKGNSYRTAYDFATQHLTDVRASLAAEDPKNKALLDAAVAAQALVASLASQYSDSTLTIDGLSEYTQKMEAYIDAIDAFTAEIADFNTITFCKEIWTTAQAARETKSLSAMQTLAYDALQSYRQKGEAEGASASDIEKYAEKTRLYLHANDAEDNKTLKTDIDAFLKEKYSTTDGLKEYFELDNLVIAYDYWIVRSDNHSNVAGHPLSQFADLYVKYVVNAEKGTATEEYLTLADAFLQDQLLSDTSWKLSQHIGSIPVFLMKGTDYESIRDAWFADKSNSAKAQAYFDVVQYSLISCTVAGRGMRNATYSATIGERLEKVVDKVAEYLKKPEYSKFITDQKTALQESAGEAFDTFDANPQNKVFNGWHGMQFCNGSKVTLAQITYEKVTWRDGVYKRKFVDQNITNEATSAMQLSGFELIKVVYNDYVSDEYAEKKDLIAYDLYNLLSGSFGAIWSDYWSYHADGQPSNIKSVTVLTKEADEAQAKL